MSALAMMAVYNGLFITKKYAAWHALGWVMRVLLVVYFWPDRAWTLLAVWIASVPYDIIINLMMGKSWGYVGETAWFDKFITSSYWIGFVVIMGKITLTFLTVAYILIDWFGL